MATSWSRADMLIALREDLTDLPPYPPLAILWLARLVALGAVSLCTYLFLAPLLELDLTFACSARSQDACAEFLGNRWSTWFGLPVTVLGIITYLMVFFCLIAIGAYRTPQAQRDAWSGLVALVPSLMASAIWFSWLQQYQAPHCQLCQLVHYGGLALAAFILYFHPVWKPTSLELRYNRRTRLPLPIRWTLLLAGLVPPAILVVGQLMITPGMW